MAYKAPSKDVSALDLARKVDTRVVACEFYDIEDTQFYIVTLPDEVIFAFRGTSTVTDALDDMKVSLVCFENEMKVHRGFLIQLRDAWKSIQDFLTTSSHTNICFVGHSLGGAVACLAATETARRFQLKPRVVTFGCPKIGNAKFASFFDALVPDHLRYVHGNDAVTYVPWFVYHHCGNEVCVGKKRFDPWSRIVGSIHDHTLEQYRRFV